MTDSMKFGPEWIRNLSEACPMGLSSNPSTTSHHHSSNNSSATLSGSSSSSSTPTMRYTLAEHRYGREEMLALYSSTLTAPHNLKLLSGLYVEKSQQPLALFTFTDDELRIWNRGVNPDGLGRGGTGKGPVDGSTRGRRDSGREGRGRGRGGGAPGSTYFPRPPGPGNPGGPYPGDVPDPSVQGENLGNTFNRNRASFDRQVSGDRSWSERNGGAEGSIRGRGGGDTNWRRHRGEEEPGGNDPSSLPGGGNNNQGGWRPQPKWQHPGRSWRDEDSWTERDPRMSNHHLPEWAMEKSEGIGCGGNVGSFENGAFQGDDIPPKRRDRPPLLQEQKSKSECKESEGSDSGGGGGGDSSDRDKDRIHEPPERDSQYDQAEPDRRREDDPSCNLVLEDFKKKVERIVKNNELEAEISELKRQLGLFERKQQQQVKQLHTQTSIMESSQKDVTVPKEQISHQISPPHIPPEQQSQVTTPGSHPQQMPSNQHIPVPPMQHQHAQMLQQQPTQPQVMCQQQPLNQPPQPPQQQQPVLNQQQQAVLSQQQQQMVMLNHQQQQQQQQQQQHAAASLNQLQQQALLNQQQQQVMNQQPISPISSPQQVHQPLNSLARLHQAPAQPILQDHLDDHSINDNIATDLVAKLMEEEEKRDRQWYYKDPQGQVQGPFSCGEMAEWFHSGYFNLGLMVKRACDPSFSPLGDLTKIWGCIPFLNDQAQSSQVVMPPQDAEEHANQAQANAQYQEAMMHQFKMDQYNHQYMLLRQQQQAMANRNQSVKMPGADWPEHHAQQKSGEGGGQQASLQLRALLAQMQAHQQLKQAQQQTSKVKEGGGGAAGNGAVMETLMSLHQQQVAQQAALQQALQAAHMAESQGGSGGGGGSAGAIRSLVTQMQQGKLRWPNQQANVDSVWNGGTSWKQWSQVNPKGIKTEQQVLEEQMRAEDERKREEMRKHEEVVRISEDETKERKRDKQDEKSHNERNKRDSEEVERRRMEEEEHRRKQEMAAQRAQVEKQRKEEDKKKKDEDKRRKEEEKRKQVEERERLKHEDEIKKKEAEEAKKRQQDLMSKIQRAQWCPPQASNTSLLDIQRSEREQQVLRTIREQEAAAAQAAVAAEQVKSSMHLKWHESARSTTFVAESLDEIQAQQYRQFIKVQEKMKADREKKEAAAAASNQQLGGTWSQGLNWGALPQQPVWHNSQGGASASVGFWDQLTGPKQAQNVNVSSQPNKTSPMVKPQSQAVVNPPQQQQSKETKSKAKREELAVMQLFGNQTRQDEFTQWCQQTLTNLPMNYPFDIPTFVSFLRDIESGQEVVEYVRGYVGDSKEANEFARQFLERRHSLSVVQSSHSNSGLGQQSSNTVERMGGANQQALHSSSEDFQQVKSKGKNKKKGRVTKMQTVDPRILGFSSTASPDRINVGDREYPQDL